MSERLEEIKKENAKFEKETPYNFCDRWCERCAPRKQIRCKVYQDEFEQKVTCIAHGRDPDDPEITEEVMRRQCEEMSEELEQFAEENEINLDEIDDPELEPIKKHIKFVESHPLPATVEQYYSRAHKFLENTFYKKDKIGLGLANYFETVAWFHTLLPAKLERALAGFHEPACEGDLALYDAVAQFEICKKAIDETVSALHKIKPHYPDYKNLIIELLALLHNISSRIEHIEQSI